MPVDHRAFTERTALAWNRSGLALAILGAVALRTAERTDRAALGEAMAAVSFAGAAGLWAYGDRLYRARTEGVVAGQQRAFGLLTAVTVLVAAAALALALLG